MKDSISITAQRLAWSVGETSMATGLSTGFLRKEIKSGRLRARRVGRRILILDEELRLYLSTARSGDLGVSNHRDP